MQWEKQQPYKIAQDFREIYFFPIINSAAYLKVYIFYASTTNAERYTQPTNIQHHKQSTQYTSIKTELFRLSSFLLISQMKA